MAWVITSSPTRLINWSTFSTPTRMVVSMFPLAAGGRLGFAASGGGDATGSGTDDLRRALAERMPEGPWLYPEDQVTDVQLRFMAAEITRERLYDRLHEELPYASTVETEGWEERADGSVKIDQVIYVERDSQKMIVLGKGGQTIKLIGQQARQEMERQFERRVHLFIFVKVRENWTKDPERLRMMGLDVKG